MKRITGIFVAFVLLVAAPGCKKDSAFEFTKYTAPATAGTETRNVTQETRNVLIIYSAGFNSLSSYLKEDISDLQRGFVPQKRTRADHVLLVYSRLPSKYRTYSPTTKSALFRIYKDDEGNVIRDTLRTWDEDTNASSASTMREVLEFTASKFPAKGYGMVFTSHSSGWLPERYYTDPSEFEGGIFSLRSMGQDVTPAGEVEMELKDFAGAIPFRLDYMLIDACLAGGVEVAFQLRGKADIVGFSQTEILADGFDYPTIASRLLKKDPDPVQVCKDYFAIYDARTGVYNSATISAVDTRQMEDLALVSRDLFEKYRTQMAAVNPSKVQGFFRYDRHYFYDLKDILEKSGASESDLLLLQNALDKCILYKANTRSFMSDFAIRSYCGLSMYLPANGSDFLDTYYRTLDWNIETKLVE